MENSAPGAKCYGCIVASGANTHPGQVTLSALRAVGYTGPFSELTTEMPGLRV